MSVARGHILKSSSETSTLPSKSTTLQIEPEFKNENLMHTFQLKLTDGSKKHVESRIHQTAHMLTVTDMSFV